MLLFTQLARCVNNAQFKKLKFVKPMLHNWTHRNALENKTNDTHIFRMLRLKQYRHQGLKYIHIDLYVLCALHVWVMW